MTTTRRRPSLVDEPGEGPGSAGEKEVAAMTVHLRKETPDHPHRVTG